MNILEEISGKQDSYSKISPDKAEAIMKNAVTDSVSHMVILLLLRLT